MMKIYLDTVDSSIRCIFIKRLDFGLGSSVVSIGVELTLSWEICVWLDWPELIIWICIQLDCYLSIWILWLTIIEVRVF